MPPTEGDPVPGLGRPLWLLLGAALALRLALIAVGEGSQSDLGAFRLVDQSFRDDPLHVYSAVNREGHFAWPYPPLYFPVVSGLSELSQAIDVGFAKLIRLPQVAADLAIVWLVQWHLGFKGLSPRVRLTAAAMIAFNPALVAMSGLHGQIDPLQWLPAVGAVIAWERLPPGRRGPVAGILLGLGAGLKIVPGVVLLALLPLARDGRERLITAASCVAVPFVLTLPFLIANPDDTLALLDYNGVAGQGGLSMIVQPGLATVRFAGDAFNGYSGAEQLLQDAVPILMAAGLAALTIQLFRTRPEPAIGAALVILTVYVFGGNYLSPYGLWLVPFIVLAGWTRFYWVTTALMLLPLFFLYAPLADIRDGVYDRWAVLVFYIPAAAALWAAYAWKLSSFFRGYPTAATWGEEPASERGPVATP